MRFKRIFSLILITMQLVGVFVQLASAQVARRGPITGPRVTNMQQGLQIKLSEGVPVAGQPAPNPRANATPLAADETNRVLQRLEPIKAEASDEQDFALR